MNSYRDFWIALSSEVPNSEEPIHFLDSFRHDPVRVMSPATLAEMLRGSIVCAANIDQSQKKRIVNEEALGFEEKRS
jgi:hypothetical protein